jgi:hypothetical protein
MGLEQQQNISGYTDSVLGNPYTALFQKLKALPTAGNVAVLLKRAYKSRINFRSYGAA